jgi:glycosyltransferase involved in cell wall biosynthesis
MFSFVGISAECGMNEKISVIIPLYNKEHEIKRTLDSILSQTYQNFEIIVVDDLSTDRGPAIVRSYNDPRISFIPQEHHGVSYTRNHGIDLATGNFVAFLDADDEWMPNHLETILGLIDKFPGAGMYTTAYKIRTNEGKTRWAHYKNIPNPPWEGLVPDYFKSGALGDQPVNATTVVIPKKIFHEMGGFPEGYWWGEDVDLFGKIALKYPVAFSGELGGIYHLDALNRACNKTTLVKYEDEPFVNTALSALRRQEVPPEFIESISEYIAIRKIFRAIQYLHAGDPGTAQIILKNCSTRWYYHEKMKWLILASIPYPVFLFIRDIKLKIFNKF